MIRIVLVTLLALINSISYCQDSMELASAKAPVDNSHLKLADSFFVAANNKLKVRWSLLDSATIYSTLEDYSKAIELNPDLWQAYRNRARIYTHLKRFAEAGADITIALKHADKNHTIELYEMRGKLYYETGQYKNAIPDLDIAVELSHDRARYMMYRAKAKWKTGQKKDACKDYEEVLKINPDYQTQKEFLDCK